MGAKGVYDVAGDINNPQYEKLRLDKRTATNTV